MESSHNRRRVVVTGLGVIVPNGVGAEAFWKATRAGLSGISRLDRFDLSEYTCKIAGTVSDFDPAEFMSSKTVRMTDRSTHFAVAASSLALADARIDLQRENVDRVGVSLGTALGGICFYEEQIVAAQTLGLRRASPLCVPRVTPNAPASYIAAQHGVCGPNLTTCTACSSGAHAIGLAGRMIRDATVDVVLCGGTEACVSQYSFRAFDAMRVMSSRNDEPERACRPFDKNRDGFVMGEGAAVLVLEEREHARARSAAIYGELLGYGASAGAYHIVMPVPDGSDAVKAMRAALDDAGIDASQVDTINAHGTATPANDRSETLAIRALFGERAGRIPVTSTKSVIGHTIGAAGAIEAVACLLSLRDQVIPPTANYETPDPECDLDVVSGTERGGPVRVVLNNSFGFGNNNAALVFGREDLI